jgi:hypothetical protein
MWVHGQVEGDVHRIKLLNVNLVACHSCELAFRRLQPAPRHNDVERRETSRYFGTTPVPVRDMLPALFMRTSERRMHESGSGTADYCRENSLTQFSAISSRTTVGSSLRKR